MEHNLRLWLLTMGKVADKLQKPLYYLTAEDLGNGVSSLGTRLKEVFRLAIE